MSCDDEKEEFVRRAGDEERPSSQRSTKTNENCRFLSSRGVPAPNKARKINPPVFTHILNMRVHCGPSQHQSLYSTLEACVFIGAPVDLSTGCRRKQAPVLVHMISDTFPFGDLAEQSTV
jgi:hypothetical protein